MGVHPKVVQEMLGHNQISMTMDIYSHVLPTMQEDAASKLNDVFTEHDEEEDEALEDKDTRDEDDGMAGAGVPRGPKKR